MNKKQQFRFTHRLISDLWVTINIENLLVEEVRIIIANNTVWRNGAIMSIKDHLKDYSEET